MPTATADLIKIAGKVRVRRAELGWSQQELANKADVARRTVTAIEQGEYRAHYPTYGKIATALGLSLTDITGAGE